MSFGRGAESDEYFDDGGGEEEEVVSFSPFPFLFFW